MDGTLASVRKGTEEAMTQVQENLYGHTGARVQSTQEGATHTYCYAGGRMLCDDTGSSAVAYLYAGTPSPADTRGSTPICICMINRGAPTASSGRMVR